MKRRILIVTLAVLAFGILCGWYWIYGRAVPVPTLSNNEPVTERESTRIKTLQTDYRTLSDRVATLSLVTDKLDAPWAFSWLPSGEILVSERFGTLRKVRDGTLLAEPVSGVPEVFRDGQGGLLDVTVHPNFEQNNYVYLSYAHGYEEQNRLRVARGELRGITLQNVKVIFEVAQTKSGGQHFGSRFAWLPDNTLVFSVGDGGNPPTEYNGELIRNQAQNLSTHFGKIIRINDDGTIPSDNPFVDRPDVLAEIFSYGHRNVQGIAYDSALKRLVASEHGSKGGDELNVLREGENYGWPLATFATEYSPPGRAISPFNSIEEAIDPIIAWTPTIAPSSLVHFTSDRYGADYKNNFFVAAMLLRESDSIISYIGSPPGAIIRITSDREGNVTGQTRIMVGDVRVRSIGQGPDGYLYVLTDKKGSVAPGSQAGLSGESKIFRDILVNMLLKQSEFACTCGPLPPTAASL